MTAIAAAPMAARTPAGIVLATAPLLDLMLNGYPACP